VNEELRLFDPVLAEKPQIVVANKIDLPEARAKLSCLQKELASSGFPFCAISAVTGEGLRELKRLVASRLEQAGADSDNDRVAAGL